ncbi:MAG: hypothetical protein SNJ74_12865 [Fimbriimonadaceae bacterium]
MNASSPKVVWIALFALVSLLVGGCGRAAPPDAEMTVAPTGLWIADGTGVTVDIQSGGYIRIVDGGRERVGTWESPSDGLLRVTLDGETFDMPYRRQDLELELTLPGSSAPSVFTQM